MLCPKCKQEIAEKELICSNCGINIADYYGELLKQQSAKQTKLYFKQPLINRFIFYTFWAVVAAGLLLLTIPSGITPHFRSYISRTKGEQNSIATALEAYFVDYSTYPYPDYDAQGIPIVPNILTAPISIYSHKPYLSNIPNDPFSSNGKQSYRYYSGWAKFTFGKDTGYNGFWIVAGNGPDKKPDLEVTTFNSADSTWYQRYGIFHEYDPTNGSKSSGDLWRTGP